ncbi:class B sortase [Anaerobacillus sp. CMMVII]|uniref:class B sortase n=1 Tax=Anaerobacillus sp. CMMVII TaxID=2755588 RepID=UPI0021B7E73C|nr:class B sortase [Anaerobacillus sp. CMMVII]MCT8137901.1 class B sortase [Anaerobacillus sp. CMMVII]
MNRFRIISIVCTVIFLFSMYNVYNSLYDSYKNKQLYTSIQTEFIAHMNDIQTSASDDVLPLEETRSIMDKFLPLLEKNEDTVGWITIPNTQVDYPIVKKEDNDFYLHHNFEGERSNGGTIFMDFRNIGDGTDRHTILYGHNMRDGTMFQGLMKYKQSDFFSDNQMITFYTLYEETKWEIFSAYVTDTNYYYIPTRFRSKRDYLDFLEGIQGKSLFQSEIEFTDEDKILTLSTCSYEFLDARFVVHARKVN